MAHLRPKPTADQQITTVEVNEACAVKPYNQTTHNRHRKVPGAIAAKIYDLKWPLGEIQGCVFSSPCLLSIYRISLFRVCKRSYNGLVGTSLVDLLSVGHWV